MRKIWIINCSLFIIVLIVAYNFFWKSKYLFQFENGNETLKLEQFLEDKFSINLKPDITLIFIFNQLPKLSQIEILNKIYSKYKNSTSIHALFLKKFKSDIGILFPHKFQSGVNIEFKNRSRLFQNNFLLSLKQKKYHYITEDINLEEIASIIRGQLFPEETYTDRTISINEIRERVKTQLENKKLQLYDLKKKNIVELPMQESISTIYLFHSNCTVCSLNYIFTDNSLMNHFNKENEITIFSVLGDTTQIRHQIFSRNIEGNIYVDLYDSLDLLGTYSQNTQKPIIIRLQGGI